ncbi:hypothetical protein MASR2M74_03160 [Paracoccaceae bacterium]
MRWYLALWLILTLATPAEAGPLITAIGGLITAISAFAGSSAIAGWLVKTVASIALSRLAMALRGTPRQPGIKTEMTTTGGTTPQRIMLGRYATGGQLIAPPMSYGSAGKTPRAWLVYTIALSVVPGCTLARVVINDGYVALGPADPSWGRPVTGDLAGAAWIDFLDGSQTAVHPDLLAAFATDPDRPWASDMIGPGTAYAVCRFKYDRERFNGLPALRFEMLGIPLYDPRADSTVGGSGAQRWSDPSSWAQTENPVVMIYNILRGIDVGAGMIWGGECEDADLPLANWFAAMNECDVPVALDGGGTEAQYRAGIEIELDTEPAGVIEELLKTCAGAIVEVGGVWKIRVGAPALPSYFLTDEDVIASETQEFAPFPGLSDTYNGITATYPEPASLWEAKDAPPRFSSSWEAEDGGRRLVANLSLPACPHGTQVQRLMTSGVADHRRMRGHRLVLPPEAAVLEPLETVGWTSPRWGYSSKTFEITSLTDSLMSMLQGLSLRERDAGDFAWEAADEIAVLAPSTTTTPPTPQAVPGFSASPEPLADGAAIDRRPAIRLAWDADGADDARALAWELRLDGGVGAVLSGSHADVGSGNLVISDGLIPGQAYEARAIYLVDRATDWSDWEPVTAPSILISTVDVAAGAVEARFDMASEAALDIATGATETVVFDLSLPATFVDSTGVPAVFAMTVRVRNDDTGRTRIACRLRALTGPDDHPDTGDWENLGLEYIYLRGSADQDIEYKQAIWIIDDFDFTAATRLQIEASYLTNATYTGTDTAFGKRVFSGRQTKRG